MQPLRLAVPRRLLALASCLIEHHIAPLQPDVIKPEAIYIYIERERERMHANPLRCIDWLVRFVGAFQQRLVMARVGLVMAKEFY